MFNFTTWIFNGVWMAFNKTKTTEKVELIIRIFPHEMFHISILHTDWLTLLVLSLFVIKVLRSIHWFSIFGVNSTSSNCVTYPWHFVISFETRRTILKFQHIAIIFLTSKLTVILIARKHFIDSKNGKKNVHHARTTICYLQCARKTEKA